MAICTHTPPAPREPDAGHVLENELLNAAGDADRIASALTLALDGLGVMPSDLSENLFRDLHAIEAVVSLCRSTAEGLVGRLDAAAEKVSEVRR